MSTGVPLRTRWHKSWLRVGPTLVVVAAIFGVIALSCVTALYVGRHCERFLRLSSTPDGSEAVAAIPMEYALKSTEYNDVIFVGDSAPLYAIDPKCFQDLTGLKAYNLASFRPVSVNGFVIAVQAYLSRHPAPRLVVLCVSPEVPGGTDVERDFAKRFVRVYGTQIGGKNPAVNAIVQSIVNEDGYEVLIKRGVSILQDDFAYWFQSKARNVFDEVLVGSDKETTTGVLETAHRESRLHQADRAAREAKSRNERGCSFCHPPGMGSRGASLAFVDRWGWGASGDPVCACPQGCIRGEFRRDCQRDAQSTAGVPANQYRPDYSLLRSGTLLRSLAFERGGGGEIHTPPGRGFGFSAGQARLQAGTDFDGPAFAVTASAKLLFWSLLAFAILSRLDQDRLWIRRRILYFHSPIRGRRICRPRTPRRPTWLESAARE